MALERHRQFTGLDLIRIVNKVTTAVRLTGYLLRDEDDFGEPIIGSEKLFLSGKTKLTAIKDGGHSNCQSILSYIGRINTLVAKAGSKFIEDSLSEYAVLKSDFLTKVSDIETVATGGISSIAIATNETACAALAPTFVAMTVGLPEVHPSFLSVKEQSANIANSLLDAVSYILVNVHDFTGAAQVRSTEDIKKISLVKCGTAGRYLEQSGTETDVDTMRTVVEYLEANIPKALDYPALAVLSAYIDSNVEKLIMVRRAWAL